MFGAYSASVLIPELPSSSRRVSSQMPSLSRYGAYCTRIDLMCYPFGASSGSVSEGITASRKGCREGAPYFASS